MAATLLLLLLPLLYAQTSAGRIAGVVPDSSGAVVPNAKVAAHNADTGVDYRATSNAEGAYQLTFCLEMFNAFNHPNYGLPDANISNVNTAGSITSLIKDRREAQFALRFDF